MGRLASTVCDVWAVWAVLGKARTEARARERTNIGLRMVSSYFALGECNFSAKEKFTPAKGISSRGSSIPMPGTK
jgi:hypothetical protein